jgi:hypothetical protein
MMTAQTEPPENVDSDALLDDLLRFAHNALDVIETQERELARLQGVSVSAELVRRHRDLSFGPLVRHG